MLRCKLTTRIYISLNNKLPLLGLYIICFYLVDAIQTASKATFNVIRKKYTVSKLLTTLLKAFLFEWWCHETYNLNLKATTMANGGDSLTKSYSYLSRLGTADIKCTINFWINDYFTKNIWQLIPMLFFILYSSSLCSKKV